MAEPELVAIVEDGDGGEWELLCEQLAEARSVGDGSRWLMGDLALRIEGAYGEGSVVRAAAHAGLARASLYSYRSMAAFYSPDYRELVAEKMPAITWSHMREAKRCGELEEALDLLELAQHGTDEEAGAWSVERLRVEVVKRRGVDVPPRERVLLETETTVERLPVVVRNLGVAHALRVRVRIVEVQY